MHRLGRRVLVYDRLDSTNSRAAQLAVDPANDGVAVLAEEQTAGRGQHGRRLAGGPGGQRAAVAAAFPARPCGGPVSLLPGPPSRLCRTIQKLVGSTARIKWPNDILLGGRKVCGILIEQGRGTVAGIGLNVRQSEQDFHDAGLLEATSLVVPGDPAPGHSRRGPATDRPAR